MKTNINHKANLPTFSDIVVSEVPDKLNELLDRNRQKTAELLQQAEYSWENLIQPLEEMGEDLHHFWSPISHMNAVVNSKEIREVYHQCLPILAEYHTEIKHNQKLYQAIQDIAASDEFKQFDHAQQKIIENALRDFKLAGAGLNEEKKHEFAELVKDLSQLSSKFEENLLDATNAWSKHIIDEKEVAGIPANALAQAKERAEQEGLTGWKFTLSMPSYLALITHADSRTVREEAHLAFITRASDQGPFAGKWDNSEIMQSILSKRLALAQLLGFQNYAELSLATKMVKKTDDVIAFLTKLAKAAVPKAKEEMAAITQFASEQLNLKDLQPWDIAYAGEKLRQYEFDISQEKLRPYFPEHNVVNGLFAIVKRLFEVEIVPIDNVDVWHPDARCYALYDKKGTLRSYFYLDLYARSNKRGGAWMDDCRGRRKTQDGQIQIPIAFIIGNFNRPTKDKPALFSHDEVVTLFHEFGHALQHMLTTINYSEVSGINGIPWDAVELASQFLENWTWNQDSLSLFAKHYATNEILPNDLFDKLYKTKNFQSAMFMVRQLEFALFDFLLHMHFDPKQKNQIQTILEGVRKEVTVVPVIPQNRFQHSFSHIFAGGYAAGYYSYKWAEVMASDAFSLFLEKGIFDKESANRFLTYILEPGGSEEPADLYRKFRGRDPKIEALLQQSGIIQ